MIDRSIQYNSRKDHLQKYTSFIKGVVVPILTICDKDEKIDEAKQRAQVDYVIKGGVTGILAFGSNGEFYMLEEDEMERGLKIMVDQAAGTRNWRWQLPPASQGWKMLRCSPWAVTAPTAPPMPPAAMWTVTRSPP